MGKKPVVKRMTIVKGEEGWEIEDPNNPDCPLVGPYPTKKEAEEGKRGLTTFYRNEEHRPVDDYE